MNLESYSAFSCTEANQGSTSNGSASNDSTKQGSTAGDLAAKAPSGCALCSARSTVAIRFSIRVPVNVISIFPFFFSERGLVFFLLGCSGKTPPQIFFKIFTRHALPSPHREPGSFSEATQTELTKFERLKLFLPPASWRCAIADSVQSRLQMPLQAF